MIAERRNKYKEITEDEYNMILKEYSCKVGDIDFCYFFAPVRAKPIYERGSGIIAQINGTAKIKGWKYYEIIGEEDCYLCSSEEIEIIEEQHLNLANLRDRIKLYNELLKRRKEEKK